MGDIGHELAALLLGKGDGVRHGIEGGAQLPHLVLPAADALCHPQVIFSHAEAVYHVGHLLQGLHLLTGGEGAGEEGDTQHGNSRENKQMGEGSPQVHQRRRGHGHNHIAQRLPAAPPHGLYLRAGEEAVVGKDVKAVLHHMAPGLPQRFQHGGGNGAAHALLRQRLPAADGDHCAVHISEQHIRPHQCGGLVQCGGEVLAVRLHAHAQHTPGELGYIVALLIQRLLLVTDGELKAQRHKGGGQQGEGEEDHPRRKGEVALKQGVHPFTSSNL